MAYYLVCATPKPDRLPELAEKLRQNAFLNLRSFGQAISHGLNNARWESPTVAVWEEEDYCSPPLAMERAAVLDHFCTFDGCAESSVITAPTAPEKILINASFRSGRCAPARGWLRPTRWQ